MLEKHSIHPFVCLLLSIVLLIVLPIAGAVQAAVVNDLYTARVPVADQSPSALARGAGEALAEVLVKASGSVTVLELEGVRAALDGARAQVQQYAYQRGDEGEAPLWARYEFDPAYVTGILTDNGAPLWTINRPQVLLWVIAEDSEGRHFVDRERDPEAARLLTQAFARRGVPQQFPLFDLADKSALGPGEAWRLDNNAVRAASSRYGAQHIVAARVATLSAGGYVGDWLFIGGESEISRSLSAPTLEAFFHSGAAVVADTMAARYAVAPTAASAEGVPMVVSGITAYADYAGVVRWLQSIELVERASVERVVGDRLELRLQAQADAVQLSSLIELNRRLQPVASADPALLLNYQWQK